MIRQIRKFVASLTGVNRYLFFVVLFVVCVVSLCLGIYIQFFYKYADTDPLMIGINIGSKKTAEEIYILKSNFNNLFTDSLVINSENVRVDKIEPSKTLVYTAYDLVDKDENYYDVNAQIPIININSDEAKKINSEIIDEFWNTASNVMRKKDGSSVYTVTYAAFINDEILSLVVKSSLKGEGKAEKVVIKTYNYSLPEARKVTIQELIEAKGTTSAEVQNTINQDIKTAYNNAKIIAEEYGVLYERDLQNEIYKIENTENFFLTQDGYVYIVYAYGNNDYTNEMDIIIF